MTEYYQQIPKSMKHWTSSQCQRNWMQTENNYRKKTG